MPTPQEDALAALSAAQGPALPQDYLTRALEALQATGGDPGAARWDQYVEPVAQPPSGFGEPVIPGAGPADYSQAPPQPSIPMPPEVPPTDREAAERGEPDLTGVAGYDPYSVPTPGKYGDVGAARGQENDALGSAARSYEAAGQAKLAAQASAGERQAKAYEQSAADLQALNSQTEMARQAMHAKADAETANWLGTMQTMAKQEPNPGRWWDKQDGLGLALWGLALAFGARSAGLSPGAKNAALELVQKNLHDDVESQRARMEQEMAVAKLKGVVMEKRQTRNLTDLMDDHSRSLGRLQALERAYLVRAQAPTTADEMAAHAEAKSWFDQTKMALIGQRGTQAVTANEAVLQRNHTAGQAALTRKFQDDQRRLEEQFRAGESQKERDLRRELAPVTIGTGPYRPGGAIPLDKEGLPLLREAQSGPSAGNTTGAILVGPDGKPASGTGVIRFRKEDDKQAKEFGDITTGASQYYKTMKRVTEILADTNRVATLVAGNTDPELASLMTSLGTEQAKADDPGGRYTNSDFSRGLKRSVGFDPDGRVLERFKFAESVEDIRKLIKDRMAELPKQVNKSIAPLNDAAINGQGTTILWDPVNLEAPQLVQPNAREAARNAADVAAPPTLNREGTALVPTRTELRPTVPAPKTIKAYESALSTETADPSRRTYLLPEHDAAKVQDVIDFSKGRSPEAIKQHAAQVLDTIIPNKGPGISSTVQELPPKERETAKLVITMRDDAVRRAEKSIADLADAVQRLNFIRQGTGKDPLSADSIRSMAKKSYALTDAEDVIQAAIAKVGAK